MKQDQQNMGFVSRLSKTHLFPGVLLSFLLVGCMTSNLPEDLPLSSVAERSPANLQWQPLATPNSSHRLDGLVFIGIAKAGWNPERMKSWAVSLPERLGECSVALGKVELRMIEDGEPEEIIHTFHAYRSRSSGSKEPLIVFADHVTNNLHNGHVSSGVTRPLPGTSYLYATIARRTKGGRRLKAEQTVTHELGHILGLKHTARDGLLTLMHPRGCLRCSFTASQCATIRSHPAVSPL